MSSNLVRGPSRAHLRLYPGRATRDQFRSQERPATEDALAKPTRRVVRQPHSAAKTPLPSVVNVHEAKTQLSRLLVRVAAGEEITIARAGQPFARLVPLTTPASTNRYLALGIADAVAAYDREHGKPETDFPEVWLERSPPKPDPLEE